MRGLSTPIQTNHEMGISQAIFTGPSKGDFESGQREWQCVEFSSVTVKKVARVPTKAVGSNCKVSKYTLPSGIGRQETSSKKQVEQYESFHQ